MGGRRLLLNRIYWRTVADLFEACGYLGAAACVSWIVYQMVLLRPVVIP